MQVMQIKTCDGQTFCATSLAEVRPENLGKVVEAQQVEMTPEDYQKTPASVESAAFFK